jgi:hypothetical protein
MQLPKGAAMTKHFDKFVNPDALIAACKAKKFAYYDDRFNRGGDHIGFEYIHADMRCRVYFNTFNGQFFCFKAGSDEPFAFDHSLDLDDQQWYSELLDMLYLDDAPQVSA